MAQSVRNRIISNIKRLFAVILYGIALFGIMSNTVHAEQCFPTPFRGNPSAGKYIALTFDDGPHRKYTDMILDILKKYGIHATFFVVGSNCRDQPETVKRIVSEGHEIGSHTFSHPSLCRISRDKLMKEILNTENILFEICEYRPKLFRPPEGVYGPVIASVLERLDYTPVLWTVDTLDWRVPSAETIADRVIKNISDGYIVLCHDFISPRSNTPDALELFLPRLIEEGWQFVTVSELMQMG